MRFKTAFLAVGLMGATAISGCSTIGLNYSTASYSSVTDAGYVLPAIPRAKVPPQYLRQEVRYDGAEEPGTIIVDTGAKFLYLVLGGGKAMRYGIGVGKEGFEWNGTARVALKREWPRWTPPSEMIKRKPELAEFRGGMEPGLQNPLGARALYLFNKRGDTGYRLHGTPEWWSIGKAMSSGCIRLMNQDIIDLYNRAQVGAKVIVK
ncbi:L,D-transpeptidase [Phyllobacterium sp. 21LDTY02-6]|jgi:lipoprotein-anchoring transpeptidase ErfK/SrfK|uniref:L,D-transpeptidase n=1 Tax=unclassified Phyllobacterium TaxID=2638441 RepID=UPI00202026D6|nr:MULTISPECIES: L,D-transpeptidase [unclassified Phyllobacterium]MCO4317004.1 L,D-transpeptidase [Phyllobacterium sp. 21LDTY02-6]MCX8282416.1 L,D-transpeptidase [Phyllobacterium sp. 0TCS1.6C]MCX8295231.1 L,D-transpeptidase [Phyllobacterium sp. 0TCS1.6A]